MPTPAETKTANRALTAVVRKSFPVAEREFSLEVEFSAAPGFTILFGASGSGKTTLLDCIAGLTSPDAGTNCRGRTELCSTPALAPTFLWPSVEWDTSCRTLHCFRISPSSRTPNMDSRTCRVWRASRERRRCCVNFRIEHLRQQRPAEISGGERQRVALARALVTDPCVLLLDEPLAALDVATKSKILDDLRRWNQAHGIPILYVTHSREEVIALGERVLVMDQGRIIAQGTPHEVLSAPLPGNRGAVSRI